MHLSSRRAANEKLDFASIEMVVLAFWVVWLSKLRLNEWKRAADSGCTLLGFERPSSETVHRAGLKNGRTFESPSPRLPKGTEHVIDWVHPDVELGVAL
ncbi:hypothetical protein CH63R_08736 [Colletotrichum higginsianum IMI 349063]|uniref:Uncharacterized protein n=1 Tax=Colletotrichum higginsianum (strain IMI 349063) TaxID=759273 RepID=A0A1B7Y5E0_COLHI|nr:hypothetical protein CH63R_08736 [Colletotrichum higginsianum IMI 349063]OBR07215.1 hypothetical protein CH63R_08736 [Colletotrichum higginsianum IMI 349063]